LTFSLSLLRLTNNASMLCARLELRLLRSTSIVERGRSVLCSYVPPLPLTLRTGSKRGTALEVLLDQVLRRAKTREPFQSPTSRQGWAAARPSSWWHRGRDDLEKFGVQIDMRVAETKSLAVRGCHTIFNFHSEAGDFSIIKTSPKAGAKLTQLSRR
jgi:hypothetical protein